MTMPSMGRGGKPSPTKQVEVPDNRGLYPFKPSLVYRFQPSLIKSDGIMKAFDETLNHKIHIYAQFVNDLSINVKRLAPLTGCFFHAQF